MRKMVWSLAVLIAAVWATGCSSSATSPGQYQYPCVSGTNQTLANPLAMQAGVPTTIGQITIVAFGSSNALYSSYGQWIVSLVDNTGMPWTGAPLRLVSDPSGPHPYPSDFYYASSIPMLNPGHVYRAYLSQPNAACTGIPLGQFST